MSCFENAFIGLGTNLSFFPLVGGFLPALFWLWFWLKEDRIKPEPRLMLIVTFIGGMGAVLTSIILQNYFYCSNPDGGRLMLTLYVVIEELSKFAFAYLIALHSQSDDEPIDPLIYMIATALGFAALENTLFITGILTQAPLAEGVITGILRFFGATLLHTVSSGAIGVALGLSFYKKPSEKFAYAVAGTFIAIILHVLFNLFIMVSEGVSLFIIFSMVWLSILVIILFFEKLKKVYPPAPYKNIPIYK